MAPPVRLRMLDAVRGIAALWVVLYHAAEGRHVGALRAALPPALDRVVFEAGWMGVPVFFVLSGFVVAAALHGRAGGLAAMAGFLWRRAVRLTPPYYASIAFGLAMAALAAQVRGRAAAPLEAGRLFAHLGYAQDLAGYEPLNPAYWTLALEMQFYAAFALLLLAAHALGRWRRGSELLVAGAALAMAMAWPLGLAPPPPWPGTLLPLWHGFLLGALAYAALQGRWPRTVLLAYGALLATVPSAYTLACLATAALLFLAGHAGRLERGLDVPVLQFTGAVSYSLYLTHNAVTGAAFFLAYGVLARTPAGEALALLAALAACLAFAWVFHRAIERPSLAWSRRGARAGASPCPST